MGYSLEENRPTPFKVIDNFDICGREGIYSGTYEDCQAFIAAQPEGDILGMYDIIPNPYFNLK